MLCDSCEECLRENYLQLHECKQKQKSKKTNMIFHNPWSKCIQLLCQLEDPQFTIGFIAKWLELPRVNVTLEARFLTGWQQPKILSQIVFDKRTLTWCDILSHGSVWNKTRQPLELGSSNLNIDHSSFCLKYRRMMQPGSRESQFLEQIVWSWLINISCTGVKFTRVGVTLRFETQSSNYIIKLQKIESP